MRHLAGFAALEPTYDGFILDLWGVIHDGVSAYPGAIDCLTRLRATGKPVVLLSNAPRRAAVARAAMRPMGIDDSLYTGIMTSGEAVNMMLRARSDSWFAALGPRVYHLGPARDLSVVDDAGLSLVAEPEAADWLLNTGPDDLRDPTNLSGYEPELRRCFSAGLKMVCANPDLEVIRGGQRILCAGALAELYAAWGGEVRLVGKPDPAIYAPVLAMLGQPAGRILAVGDSLRTDIAGAAAAGIASCWVLGGIQSELVGQPARAEVEAARVGLLPIATLPAFMW